MHIHLLKNQRIHDLPFLSVCSRQYRNASAFKLPDINMMHLYTHALKGIQALPPTLIMKLLRGSYTIAGEDGKSWWVWRNLHWDQSMLLSCLTPAVDQMGPGHTTSPPRFTI